jgi:pilus assembly protein CpaE
MAPDKPIRILLIEDNPLNARTVEEMLRRSAAPAFEVTRAYSLVNALDLLVRLPFDAILLDLMLPDSEGLETFLATQRHAPRVPIVVLTSLEDEAMALTAVAKGAQDYLSKGNLSTEALVRAVTYAVVRTRQAALASQEGARKGAVLAFVGAKGGVGTTTLACHFAAELQRQTGKRTLLFDLEPHGSGAAFLVRAEPRFTVADAAANLHRLDRDLWEGMVCQTSAGFDLLASPGSGRLSEPPRADRVRHVARFAAAFYDWVVFDLGRLGPAALDLLEDQPELFVVTTLQLPELRESQRILKRLLDLGYTRERLRLLLNRCATRAALSPEDVERAVGFPVFGTVEDSADELAEAYSDGEFLRPQLRLRKQIARVAGRSLGSEAEPESGGVRKWIGRLKGPAVRPSATGAV